MQSDFYKFKSCLPFFPVLPLKRVYMDSIYHTNLLFPTLFQEKWLIYLYLSSLAKDLQVLELFFSSNACGSLKAISLS